MSEANTSAPADSALPVAAPLRVDNPSSVTWSEECDVLVIGLGAAGAAAAIAAAEAGARVVVAVRFEGGGATARSGGIVYGGGGTRSQLAAGYQDTPEAMYNYLRLETGDSVSERTLRRFCDDSRGLIEWLESIGASFESSAPPPKTSYPKDGIYLYYSGNEALAGYAEHAPPAPRGHRMRDKGLSGRALFEVLRRRVSQLGVPVHTGSAVRRLVVDNASGRVIGAELWRFEPGSAAGARHRKLMRRAEAVHNFAPGYADRLRARALALELAEAQPKLYRAARGVVLSTGGFIFNRDMVRQYAPKYLATMRLGTTGCDGSGIRLGQTVGATPARMDKVSAWRFINPPVAWAQGAVVNASGQRFCNEASYGAKLGVEMCEHQNGRAWLILDSQLRRAALRDALFGGLWAFQALPAIVLMLFVRKRATSVEALAQRIGVPGPALRQTVEAYNAAAHHRAADFLGKSGAMLQPLEKAPYYALDISAGNRACPCPAITLGGLRVDETSGEVLNGDGRAIAGLYAAGRAAVGIASNRYVSGLSIADCLWAGKRAGVHAAAATAAGQRNIA
ncbi:MAG: FAD-binding protein [Nevskia sp.]|nr:FAD-binding protein [Nevskia sp.]